MVRESDSYVTLLSLSLLFLANHSSECLLPNPPHLFKQSDLMKGVKNRTENTLLLLNYDVFDVKS